MGAENVKNVRYIFTWKILSVYWIVLVQYPPDASAEHNASIFRVED
jgi:hypothetical protein